jgi:hypothetical protein
MTMPKVRFALAPAHVREVEAARRAFDEDGVDLLLAHQLLRLGNSRAPLVVGDRDDAGGHRLERCDGPQARRRSAPALPRVRRPRNW